MTRRIDIKQSIFRKSIEHFNKQELLEELYHTRNEAKEYKIVSLVAIITTIVLGVVLLIKFGTIS